MKNLKFFFAALVCATMTFVACEDNTGNGGNGGNGGTEGTDTTTTQNPDNKPEIPVVDPVEGKIVVVLNTVDQAEVCNGLVFAGDYNGYNTNAAEMAKFEAIEGYDNWYKVEITPCTEGKTEGFALIGKPCQLAADGSFPASWDYQWHAKLNEAGEVDTEVEIIKGNAELQPDYNLEKKLAVLDGADVVYVRAYAWKKNPCVPVEKYTVSFEVTTKFAVADSLTVNVAGAMNGWNASGSLMTPNADRTVWTVSIDAVELGMEYKYTLVAESGNTYWEQGDNRKVDDREMYDEVEFFDSINPKPAEENPAE